MNRLKTKIKVLVVDDHPTVLMGINKLIENKADIEVCGEAGDINRAMELVGKTSPDVIIVDIGFNDEMDGIDLIKAVNKRYPEIKTLVHSMFDETVYAERSILAGASGYIQKDEPPGKIIEAIYKVMENKLVLSDSVKDDIINKKLHKNFHFEKKGIESLTNRELEVFQLFGKGRTIKEISEKLNLCVQTIETHRRNIKSKLDIRNNSLLILTAVEWVNSKKS
jgi:DNA-binding NarL/FixJ family response regulator